MNAIRGEKRGSLYLVQHRIDSRAMFHRGRGADVKEGIASFLEKREPLFSDKVSSEMPDLPWGEEPRYR